MYNSFRTLTFLGALVACSGCMSTMYMASPDGYVTTKSAEGGDYFRLEIRNDFSLWGLLPKVKIIEVDRVVSQHLMRDVRNISNLVIRQEVTALNMVLQTITLGIYTPRTVVIEGMIHEKRPFPPPPAAGPIADPPPAPPVPAAPAPDVEAPPG